jgi:2-keto-4-pentenoate hydratase
MSKRSVSNKDIAALLDQAEQERSPIAPLSATDTALTPQRAYAIQRAWLNLKRARGARLIGHKVGLTSLAMQQQLGVNQPDYGFLLNTMIVPSHSVLPRREFIQPRIEPEIVFWLKQELRGPGVTVEQVLQATRGVSAALEIVDSRIADWRIQLADTIADNASSARMVLGQSIISPTALNMVEENVTLFQDGNPLGAGKGEAVLGHPAAAVAWLANKLAEFDIGLQAEQWVLPGAMCASALIVAGSTYSATFGTLGEVSISFT